MNKKRGLLIVSGTLAAISGVLIAKKLAPTIPSKAQAVQHFDLSKYLGRWYEIARMDFYFEKNLVKTSAHYGLNQDGSVSVLNKGWNYKKKKWVSAHGKAKFINDEGEAKLKVSFFGPFYSGYNVIDIDPDYKFALVAGKNLKYLWILSRHKELPENIKLQFLNKAEEVGYDISKLYWVPQY